MPIYIFLLVAIVVQFGALAWLHYRQNQQEQMVIRLIQMQNMTGIQLMKLYNKTDDEIVDDYNRFIDKIHDHIH